MESFKVGDKVRVIATTEDMERYTGYAGKFSLGDIGKVSGVSESKLRVKLDNE